MIELIKNDEGLFLRYRSRNIDVDYIEDCLETGGGWRLSRTLLFQRDDVRGREWNGFSFCLGCREGSYYHIPGRVLEVDRDLYIGVECSPTKKWFLPSRMYLSLDISFVLSTRISLLVGQTATPFQSGNLML